VLTVSKIGRNAPCPCGSGKKYKKCCLLNPDGRPKSVAPIKYRAVYTELDQLSNSVVDLINQNELEKAEAVSRRLLSEYPDQVDGFDRLAMVYEARGDRKKAAQYYRKAADFAKSNPGFEKKSIDRFLSEAKRMESDQ
jgi:tetratricopeptide (TPR) repeat protein